MLGREEAYPRASSVLGKQNGEAHKHRTKLAIPSLHMYAAYLVQQLTFTTSGGLIDDCIVTNAGEYIYLVINAGHEDKDLPHMEAILADFKASGGDASIEVIAGGGLLALQGPKAVTVMSRLCPDIDFKNVKFMSGQKMKVAGYECFVTRSGYTGEDGFEMGVKREDTVALASLLLEQPEVRVSCTIELFISCLASCYVRCSSLLARRLSLGCTPSRLASFRS